MKIIEITAKTGSDGSLTVPAHVMRESGIGAGQSVKLAYLTDEAGERNVYRELLMTKNGFIAAQEEAAPDLGEFEIPADLLSAAGIPDDSDVIITCVEGTIVISQDTTDGLAGLLGELYMMAGGGDNE